MTLTHSNPVPAAQAGRTARLRLNFLDGLRGLAAFYVMVAHIFSVTAYGDDGKISASLPPLFVWATRGLCFPHYAVAVFIVLSGFCLMLPVARAEDGLLPGGLLGFAKRRARRILPPYYIALSFVLAILFLSHRFVKHAAKGATDLSAADIGTHLLLIHNLFARYSMQIDIPMWSVAWEWQIYFVFALLLLPVWRRFGTGWTVALGFLLGFLPLLLLPKALNLSWTSPWYLGLFALGMAGADALCRPNKVSSLLLQPRFLNPAVGVLTAGLCVLATWQPAWFPNFYWLGDTYIGVLTVLFILACAHPSKPAGVQAAVWIQESRPLMALGAFSYSLYLVHFPILIKLQDIVHKHGGGSPLAQFFALLLVGVPVCLGLAYLFHLAFERPFMPGHPKTERQAETAALVSPAP